MLSDRVKIEAELWMNERDRVVAEIDRALAEVDQFDRELETLPTDRSKPLAERLARVGVSKEAIAEINLMFDVLQRREGNDLNDLPEPAKQLLAKIADAEYSALDQLAALRAVWRKAKPAT